MNRNRFSLYRVLGLTALGSAALMFPAQVLGQEDRSRSVMQSYAPIHPHVASTEEGDVRVVFSRIDGDVEGGPIFYYEGVFEDGRTIRLEANYLSLTAVTCDPNCKIAFRAVFNDGTTGNLSNFLEVSTRSTDNLAEPLRNAITETEPGEESPDNARMSGKSMQMQATLAATAVPTVQTPIIGPFVILGPSAANNQTRGPWSFWQHQSGFHRPGGGIDGADDTKAYDINLNLGLVAGGAGNLDVGMAFYAVASGTVVKWHGTLDGSGTGTHPLLVEHGSGTAKYWSGYLHGAQLFARVGDYVTADTRLGIVGRAGTDNDHLHCVVYTGSNSKTKGVSLLKSVDVAFAQSGLNIAVPGPQTMRRNEVKRFATSAFGVRPFSVVISDLNSAGLVNNTWWITSNKNVATVSGTGDVRAISAGQATITVYFSGGSASTNVTVKN